MNKQELIINLIKSKTQDKNLNFIETSVRLENICMLLDEPGRLPIDQRQLWIDNYNFIARRAGLGEWIDYDYNPPESLEEQFENSI
tara:strand:+ start:377 stop:634 length:258 start_codon:yes stop_codon:yes gene_type:complete